MPISTVVGSSAISITSVRPAEGQPGQRWLRSECAARVTVPAAALLDDGRFDHVAVTVITATVFTALRTRIARSGRGHREESPSDLSTTAVTAATGSANTAKAPS